MTKAGVKLPQIARHLLVWLLVISILLGIGFRLFKLDGKIYWHDEAYTSLRAAGYTRVEIDSELFQNRVWLAPQLQQYQRLKPNSRFNDTIHSLITEDPQHPPLYFTIARMWMQWFGSSLIASRSLPALLSLLGLPLMYWLALELFASPLVAAIATGLLALSPFDILFAQTARQYSLLTVEVIASSLYLLRATRSPCGRQSLQNWLLYVVACTLGLYTHPFFALTLIGQIGFVGCYGWRTKQWPKFAQFLGALSATFLLYLPWINVLLSNQARALSTTDWTRVAVGWLYLLKLWILSFTSLFFDLDFGFDSWLTYIFRLPLCLLIGWSIYTVWQNARWSSKWFLGLAIALPFLCLALPDLVVGGKRSAISRYLISCFPSVQLVVAYWLGNYWRSVPKFALGRQLWWQIAVILLPIGMVASCTISAYNPTWWSKDLSYFNAEIAKAINSTPEPVVISDIGDDYTNTGDLISLSYTLHRDVKLLLLSQSPRLNLPTEHSTVLVFRPSQKLRQFLEPKYGKLQLVSTAGRLWQLQRS